MHLWSKQSALTFLPSFPHLSPPLSPETKNSFAVDIIFKKKKKN